MVLIFVVGGAFRGMRLGSILHVLGQCIFGLRPFVPLELVCGILGREGDPSSVSEQCVCGLTHNDWLAHHSPCCACLLGRKRIFVQVSGLRLSQGFWTNFLPYFSIYFGLFLLFACLVVWGVLLVWLFGGVFVWVCMDVCLGFWGWWVFWFCFW